jgi:outer membrane receptor for ferric coprogen and ferric-rhodotorulic acid
MQSGTNRAKGYELDLAYQPFDAISLTAGLGDLTSQDEKGIAARGVGQGLNWKVFGKYSFTRGALKGAFVGGGYLYNNRAAADANATFFTSAYRLADALAGYRKGPWSLQVNVTNATDRIYASGSVNNQNVSPGRPREFRFTTAYRF